MENVNLYLVISNVVILIGYIIQSNKLKDLSTKYKKSVRLLRDKKVEQDTLIRNHMRKIAATSENSPKKTRTIKKRHYRY